MSLQRVILTSVAWMIVACAPAMVADPPADHPASAHAETRELPMLTKLDAPAIAASQPSTQPASQPKAPPKKEPAKKPAKKTEPPPPTKTEPDHSEHDAHQHHEGGHQ